MEGESVLEAVYEDVGDYPLDFNVEGDTECVDDQMIGVEETANNHDVEEDEVNHDVEEGEVNCNDLDLAISVAKNDVRRARCDAMRQAKTDTTGKRCKRRKRKGDRKEKENFIRLVARRLQEPKVFLIEEAVKKLGVEAVHNLVKEVEAIERRGGQMTADRKRRRTPGGVLWNVLKSRRPDVYKDIMNQGKEFEKEQRKEKTKRQRMAIDEQRESKRRRMDVLDLSRVISGARSKGMHGLSHPLSLLHRFKNTDESASVEDDPDSISRSSDAQVAWMEGVKRGKEQSMLDEVGIQHGILGEKSGFTEKIRIPVGYDDLAE